MASSAPESSLHSLVLAKWIFHAALNAAFCKKYRGFVCLFHFRLFSFVQVQLGRPVEHFIRFGHCGIL